MPQLVIDDIPVELIRKNIRTLRLTVTAPAGHVRVSAPLRLPAATIHEFIQARRDWILKHRSRIQALPRPAAPAFISGEMHYYQGRAYALRVHLTTGAPRVALHAEGFLDLHVPEISSPEQRKQLLDNWYRARLKEQLPALLAQWQPVVGARAAAWGVKQMRTRWGTCNTRTKRIWLGLELIKKPLPCLEYVVVHELTHLHERLHNARFWGMMDQFMPDWRQHRAALNAHPSTPARPTEC